MLRNVRKSLCVTLPLLVLAGCMTPAPPPPKNWMVSTPRKADAELQIDRVSRLGPVTVVAPYDRPSFAVKRKDGSVAFDGSNAFASSPSTLLRAPLAALLEGHGRFGRVLTSPTSARADCVFETVVNDLSLDCTEEGRRFARVSLSIAVIEKREIKMFLDGSGSADAASGDYSAAFSQAFSAAVEEALKQLPRDTAGR